MPNITIKTPEELSITISINIGIPLAQPPLTYPRCNGNNTSWKLICSKEGWIQLADDQKARKYQQLFYEAELGDAQTLSIASKNSVYLSGSNCRDFLEKALDLVGLNSKDCNDFLTYFLPQMESYKLVQIQLLTSDLGPEFNPIHLHVSHPCTLRRIFMIWRPAAESSDVSSCITTTALLSLIRDSR